MTNVGMTKGDPFVAGSDARLAEPGRGTRLHTPSTSCQFCQLSKPQSRLILDREGSCRARIQKRRFSGNTNLACRPKKVDSPRTAQYVRAVQTSITSKSLQRRESCQSKIRTPPRVDRHNGWHSSLSLSVVTVIPPNAKA